jgi:hypothetical protein
MLSSAILRFGVFIAGAALTISGQEPVPLKIVVVEGEGAINSISERTARAPLVRVEDDDGEPMSGVTVTFTLPEMGPGGFFATGGSTYTTTTDEKGIATARGLRPNNVAGRFQIRVRASKAGQSASAVVNQINAAPAVEARRGSRKFLYLGLAAAAAVGTVVAVSAGGGGSSGGSTLPPGGSGAVVTPGSPVFGPPR